MKAFTEKLVHYTVLIVVTIFSALVMWKLSAKSVDKTGTARHLSHVLQPISIPKAPVAVANVQPAMQEVFSTYAGKIQPWEVYLVSFEAPGRVLELGTNAQGEPLDEGDRISAGQVLAIMDSRVLTARKNEAAARVQQTESELRRGESIRRSNPAALSESELQLLVTDFTMAQAQYEVAVKNLEDSRLTSPVDAVISKRYVKAGEVVNANQIVFELVQNQQVLLVVDVPESQIRELENRWRAVAKCCRENNTPDAEDKVFRAHIHLQGTDSFGNPWPSLEGEVYRIPEVADARTGLFPVEISVDNENGLLRPGMVATADVVTSRVKGYAVPEVAVLFRSHKAHLYTVERERAEMEMIYWNLGSTTLHRARQVEVPQWVDQGPVIVIPADSINVENVVVRGQFRLSDGQLVRIVDDPEAPAQVAASQDRPVVVED